MTISRALTTASIKNLGKIADSSSSLKGLGQALTYELAVKTAWFCGRFRAFMLDQPACRTAKSGRFALAQ